MTINAHSLGHMKDQAPIIECTKCGGSGKHPLHKELWATLRALRRIGSGNAVKVRSALRASVCVTAINNRLEILRDMQFVTREREGRLWIYTPVSQ